MKILKIILIFISIIATSSCKNVLKSTLKITLANLKCKVAIEQDATNLEALLLSKCDKTFSSKVRNSGYQWTLNPGSSCSPWVNVANDFDISGVPTDNHVGSCGISISARNKSTGVSETLEAAIDVINKTPTLTIADTTVLEDSALVNIRSDLDIQSSEEGFGIYSLNPGATQSPKCSDHGTVLIDPNTGEVDFDPDLNFQTFCYIGVTFNDQNPSNNLVTTNFKVTIDVTNDSPDIVGTCSSTSTEDTLYTCSGLSFNDIDVGDAHTWSLTGANTCTWLTVNPTTGVITGTPHDNQVGTCTLAVQVFDGLVNSTPYTTTITTTNVAPLFLPAIANPSNLLEDSPATIIRTNAEVNTTDENYGVYSIDNTTGTTPRCSSHGTVAINATNGQITYTPAANFDGTCYIKVIFDDQNSVNNTAASEFLVTMTAANDAPVITSACPASVNELQAYTCTSTFTDVEGDSVTWAKVASDTCGWASVDPATGAVTGTPTRSDVGTCTLAYKANDGTSDSVTYSRVVTVVNVAPVVAAVNTTLAEDSPNSIINTAAQVTSTDEGYGTYSIIAATSNDCQARGTVSIDASTGELSFAPNANYDTNCNIRIQFNDGNSSNNLGNTQITVTMIPSPDNATVTLPGSCSLTQAEDVAYSCTPTIYDPDTGNTHTWSINSNTCAWIPSIVAATGRMAGTPIDDHVGSCAYEIKAVGNQDGLVTSTLTANITVTNVQPTLTGTNPVLILMNAAAANITDLSSSDEGYGVYSLIATTSGTACSTVAAQAITINSSTGVVNYQPQAKFAGLCTINVRFDDQNSTNNTRDFQFTVNVQDFIPPEIEYIDSSSADGTYILGDTITIQVKFDEEISINTTNGTPRLFLETGAVDRYADYVGLGGPGNDTLTFTYTVQADDINADLDVHSTVSTLDLRDAVIVDRFNNTQLFHAIPLFPDADSLKAKKNLSINGTVSLATVTGLPTRVSPDLVLNATVSGGGVTEYKYKITDITQPNQACTTAAGYSANIPVATGITDSLIPFISGTTLKICVLGVNASGVVAPLTSAFEYVWTKDLFSVAKVSFASVTNLSNWQDSEVDPDNNNIVYVKNLLGEVFKSTDFGATLEHFCSVGVGYNSSLEVSPGPDRTAYVFQSGKAYKIVDNDGGACTDVHANIGIPELGQTSYNIKNYDFTSNGDLYLGVSVGANFRIYRSFNQGATWSVFSTFPHSSSSISFTMDPSNPFNMVIQFYRYGPYPTNGVYYSADAGVTRTYVRGVFDDNDIDFKWDIYNPSYVYSGISANSHKSIDGGANWAVDGGVTDFGDLLTGVSYYGHARWDIDKVTGHAYRMRTGGGSSTLQKATNLSAAGTTTWTTIYTFPAGGYYDAGLSVSVSGNATVTTSPTISVNVSNRLFISTDGGVTFTEIFAPKELKLASISSFGDDAIYGATKDWAIVKTTDNGKNWIYKQFDYGHCLGVSPRILVNREDNQKVLTWSEKFDGATNCSNFNYSVDGMNTQIARDSFSMSAPTMQVSMSINDNKMFYVSGDPSGTPLFTVNMTENNAYENTSRELSGLQFSAPAPDSYISPVDKNKMWIVDTTSSGILYEYDVLERTRTTKATGLSSVSAIDSFVTDNGAYRTRVMDRTGRMRTADPDMSVFTDEGAGSGTLTSCTSRFLYHHPKDKTLILTACLNSNIVAYSKNGGNSWTEINTLTQFNINCNLKGVALSSSKIFLACASADTFELNYTSVENVNEIIDNVLTVAEQAAGNDLINHLFPGTYDVIRYAVIADGDACNASTPGLSTTVPKSNDPMFTTRGGYRVCIEQKDLAGGFTYTTSTVIFYDSAAPVFTSIDLINDASDGKITYIESFNQTAIVGNLVSSNHDFIKYAVAPSATTCDGSLAYNYLPPQSQNASLKTAGTYKVCVQLTTKGGLSPVYGSSGDFDFEPTTVQAQINNEPLDFISTDTALNVTISGTNVTDYRYKIITTADSCSAPTGYSVSRPIATPITDDVSGSAGAVHYRLCVIGSDASGNWQSYEKATSHSWIHSKALVAAKADFSGPNNMSIWRDVAVHQSNPQLIVAVNDMGEVFKTTNAGGDWKLMCRVPLYVSRMHLKLSPGPDATAYVFKSYDSYNRHYLYRVDDIGGSNCLDTTADYRGQMYGTYYASPVAIGPTGIVYTAETQYNEVTVRRSLNFGKTWEYVGSAQNVGTNAALTINPVDPNYILLTTTANNTPAVTRGLSRSIDGGKTWSFVQTSFFDVEVGIFFDPVNAGRVYTNNGLFSTNNGSSWASDTGLNTTTVRRWFVDSSGKGYQTVISGGSTFLKRDSDLSSIGFANVNSFPVTGPDNNATVSASGATIAVIVNKQLHISTDSGTTFTQIYWPGKHVLLSGLDSSNGFNQYAVTYAFNIFASADSGTTWNYKTGYYNENANGGTGRMLAHPIYPDAAYAYNSNDHSLTISTVDGFDNSTIRSGGSSSYYSFTLAPSLTNPNHVEHLNVSNYYNSHNYAFTTDLFSTLSSTGSFVNAERLNDSFLNPFGAMYFGDENKSMYTQQGKLFETRRDEKVLSNITAKLSFSYPAGIRVVTDQSNLSYKHVVVSSTGVLNQSKDNGATYQVLGSAGTALTLCERRLLNVYPNDNNIIATACYGGNSFSFSQDGGQSWQSHSLNATYGMNCGINGITVTSSKISFSCGGYENLVYYYNPVILENLASDNILLPGDNNGQDLVSIYRSSQYSLIEYAIISAGGACSAATTGFSTTVPKGSDLAASGDYQVCVKLVNGATSYVKSSVIHYSSTTPAFTSIALNYPNGVHLKDTVLTASNLVSSLIGSNYSKSYYALVASGVTCDDSITYSEGVPKSDSVLFTAPGMYKVCVALADLSGQKAFGSSATFEYSKEAVIAKLAGQPEGVSSTTNLNITISGADVDEYKYKVGETASVDCKLAAGYSAATPAATPITDDISGLANASLTLCVLGVNSDGKDQLSTQPTIHKWNKNSLNLAVANLGVESHVAEWQDIAVSKNTATRMYASTLRGRVYLSMDKGATWEFQCQVPYDATSRIVTSDNASPLAFITSGGEVYRIDYTSASGLCPSVTSTIATINANFKRVPLAINSKNEVYLVQEVNATSSLLYFSTDRGESWSLKQTLSNLGTGVNIFIDPNQDQNLYFTFTGGLQYVYLSRNGALTIDTIIQPITPIGGANAVDFLKEAGVDLKFDRTSGNIYTNNDYFTANKGHVWSSGSGFGTNVIRWDMDVNGVAYRLNQNGANVNVQTAPTGAGTATTFRTINTLTLDGKETIAVSEDGDAIVVIVANKAYRSVSGGAFTQMHSPDTTHNLASVTSEDGATLYGVDFKWNFYKSVNGGSTYSYATTYNSACVNTPRVKTNKSNSNFVYAWAYNGNSNTGCAQNMYSTNGLTTPNFISSGLTSVAAPVALDQADSTKMSFFGTNSYYRTINSGALFSLTAVPSETLNLQAPDAVMSSASTAISWYIPSSNKLVETDAILASKTDITPSLTFVTPAGLEGYADGSMAVISRTGEINVSNDDGATFTSHSADASLQNCQRRLLRTLSSDNNFRVSACFRGTHVAYTKNNGASWTEVNLAGHTLSSSCVINDVAVFVKATNKKAIIACEGLEALTLDLD